MPEPSQLAPLDIKEQLSFSDLPPDVRTPHPICKAEPTQPPLEETHFGHFCPLCHSFSHYAKPIIIMVLTELTSLLKSPQQLYTKPTLMLMLHHWVCPPHAPFLITLKQQPKKIKVLHLQKQLTNQPRGNSFWLRTNTSTGMWRMTALNLNTEYDRPATTSCFLSCVPTW